MQRSYDHLDTLNRPEITMYLFYPRPDSGMEPPPKAEDHMIPVAPGVELWARRYLSGAPKAYILFFHGNGEIASDYDDLGPIFNRFGLDFTVVDYRGYGRSSGRPTPRALVEDALPAFEAWMQWIGGNARQAPAIVMGRSLGSAPALELADAIPNRIDGLIIESGMAYTVPLVKALGVQADRLGITEAHGFQNADKISRFKKPTLIMHAEYDQLLPLKVGQILHGKCAAENKRLYVVPGADHNDIFLRAGADYFRTIVEFIEELQE